MKFKTKKQQLLELNDEMVTLFIGDSHTAADYGWQHQVCKQTGMTYLNTAVGGQQTTWMVGVAKAKITEYFDYCFIYGGANDMAGNRPPMKSVKKYSSNS